jgi:hypothetical protein
MSYPLKTLRSISDEQLVEEHDAHAQHTGVGIDYFLNELQRRELSRQATASYACPWQAQSSLPCLSA